jgi:hypothetical protein
MGKNDTLGNALRLARIDPEEFLNTPLEDFDKEFYSGEITLVHQPIGGIKIHINMTYDRAGKTIELVGQLPVSEEEIDE